MRKNRALPALLSIFLGVTASGCQSGTYFEEPDDAGIGAPVDVGRTLYVGPVFMEAKPGDTVELVSAEAIGLDAAFVEYHAVRVSDLDDLAVGAEYASPERPLEEHLQPLAGFQFTDSDGTVQVVLAIVANRTMDLTWDAVSLQFRLNGRNREQVFPFRGRVCIGASISEGCEPPE